ncbi:MAG TPA: GDSL-type esterase/lipase family protein [Steroidobacteraceae bacterium]
MDNRLLVPIAALQGLWVLQKPHHRLPAPAHSAGRLDLGSGPALRVVGLGDAGSDGAGDGNLCHAATASYAHQLQQRWRRDVEWRVHAVHGATSACILHTIAPAVPAAHVYLVVAGAHDAIRGVQPRRHARNLHRILTLLRRKSPESTILLGELASREGVPALPWPLRTVQARRARELHEAAVAVASRHERTFCFRLPSRWPAGRIPGDGVDRAGPAREHWATGLPDLPPPPGLPALPRPVRPTTSATRGDRAARRSTRPRRPAAWRRRG